MSVAQLIKELPRRRRVTERLLGLWCEQLSDTFGLRSRERWAIVGGAIRDTLLQSLEVEGQLRLWWMWPDVDLAILEGWPEFFESARPWVFRRNSFGGWKVQHQSLGVLDVWRVDCDEVELVDGFTWDAYLDRLDFTVNALAFLWPERTLAWHPGWVGDLSRGRVTKLHPVNLPRPLAAIRAIATAAKLEELTGRRFGLCRRTAYDFYWLTHRAVEEDMESAVAYLERKLRERRWSNGVLLRLSAELARKPAARVFDVVLSQKLGDLLGALRR